MYGVEYVISLASEPKPSIGSCLAFCQSGAKGLASMHTSIFSEVLLKRFSDHLAREALGILCGERLGHGLSREVFRFAPDERYVIKFEANGEHFQNVAEWQTWRSVEHVSKHNKWFAPCLRISHCGRILIQRYAEPLAAIALPAEVPAYFTDLKPSNWGGIGGHPVAVDYGKHLMLERGMTTRMRRADWS